MLHDDLPKTILEIVMFKKLFITAAGLLLSGQAAFAQYAPTNYDAPITQNRNGQAARNIYVFRGIFDGRKVAISTYCEDGSIRGIFRLAGQQDVPIVGEFNGKCFEGVVQVNNKRYPFRAVVNGRELFFATNGHEVYLTFDEASSRTEANNTRQTCEQPAQTRGPVIHEIQGNNFEFPVIAKWEATERDNGVTVLSPDHDQVYSSTVVVNCRETSAKEASDSFLEGLNLRNMQVISTRPGTTRAGDSTMEMEVRFLNKNGEARHVWLGVGLIQSNSGNIATITMAAASEKDWTNTGPMLIDLATRIQPRQSTPASAQSQTPTAQVRPGW